MTGTGARLAGLDGGVGVTLFSRALAVEEENEIRGKDHELGLFYFPGLFLLRRIG